MNKIQQTINYHNRTIAEEKALNEAHQRLLESLPERFLSAYDTIIKRKISEIEHTLIENGFQTEINFKKDGDVITRNTDCCPEVSLRFSKNKTPSFHKEGAIRIGVIRSKNSAYFIGTDGHGSRYSWVDERLLQPEDISDSDIEEFSSTVIAKYLEKIQKEPNQ